MNDDLHKKRSKKMLPQTVYMTGNPLNPASILNTLEAPASVRCWSISVAETAISTPNWALSNISDILTSKKGNPHIPNYRVSVEGINSHSTYPKRWHDSTVVQLFFSLVQTMAGDCFESVITRPPLISNFPGCRS